MAKPKKTPVPPGGITPGKARHMLDEKWAAGATVAIALASEHNGIVRGYVIGAKKKGSLYIVKAVTGRIGQVKFESSREAHVSTYLPQVAAMQRVASLCHKKIHKTSRKYIIAARHEADGAEALAPILDQLLKVDPWSVAFFQITEAAIEEIQALDLPEFEID